MPSEWRCSGFPGAIALLREALNPLFAELMATTF
jgi:hypothetical protein